MVREGNGSDPYVARLGQPRRRLERGRGRPPEPGAGEEGGREDGAGEDGGIEDGGTSAPDPPPRSCACPRCQRGRVKAASSGHPSDSAVSATGPGAGGPSGPAGGRPRRETASSRRRGRAGSAAARAGGSCSCQGSRQSSPSSSSQSILFSTQRPRLSRVGRTAGRRSFPRPFARVPGRAPATPSTSCLPRLTQRSTSSMAQPYRRRDASHPSRPRPSRVMARPLHSSVHRKVAIGRSEVGRSYSAPASNTSRQLASHRPPWNCWQQARQARPRRRRR